MQGKHVLETQETKEQAAREEHRGRARRRWFRRRWFVITLSIVAGVGVTLLCILEYGLKHAQPMLRARVIQTLSENFKSPVELDDLRVSLLQGMEVSGAGLRILSLNADNPEAPERTQPMLAVNHFRFHLGVRDLFRRTVYLPTVYVQGLRLDLPPNRRFGGGAVSTNKEKYRLIADKIVCSDTVLVLETAKPGKLPLEFDISRLTLREVSPGKPLLYDATLVNPKPVGDIHAVGTLGPWLADNPRATNITGDYSFRNANLATIAGIAGTLSSDGRFAGPLERLVVDGETDTPNFSIGTANHPMPLHTSFHAIVDGTSGDTTLEPVHARLGHSQFVAAGTIKLMRENGNSIGHDIDLNVVMDNARIEDMLQLGVATEPPLMRGGFSMRTHLHIPPGSTPVPRKLELNGNFVVRDALFSNPSFQERVNELSMRAQGEAKKANPQQADVVTSTMSGHFVLGNALLGVTGLRYQLSGASVLLDGTYSLDGNVFDFHGNVLTDAKVSQMTTGWKSFLLKAADPFFKKDGAGAKIPIKITGTRSDPHFGLDLGHKDEKRDAKQQQTSKQQSSQQSQPQSRRFQHPSEQWSGEAAAPTASQQPAMTQQPAPSGKPDPDVR